MNDGPVYPDRFRVDDDKIRKSLLDPDHLDGGSKCAFLLSVGFALDDPVGLMAALVEHPALHRLMKVYPVPYGLRYHFEGPFACPGRGHANVRTVRQVDERPEPHPARFITLVPLRERRPGP